MHHPRFLKHVKEVEELKKIAGISACSYVQDGMILGLGTGSTVKYTIIEIGRKISEENLDIIGVPTSLETKKLAENLNIPLMTIDDIVTVDLTIDGTDEFDDSFNLIKGGGGALTREKIVAKASKSMVVVADSSKQVLTLGSFPLPIEVNLEKWIDVERQISEFCPNDISLRGGKNDPFITDNGGVILDANFGPTIIKPRELEEKIGRIQGVVEVGLFVGMCDAVVLASNEEVSILTNPLGRLS